MIRPNTTSLHTLNSAPSDAPARILAKTIAAFCLLFLSLGILSAQPVDDSLCRARIQTMFKVLDLKIKAEAVESFYSLQATTNGFKVMDDDSMINKLGAPLLSLETVKSDASCRRDPVFSFKWHTGFSLDDEIRKDTVGANLNMEVNDFVKQLKHPTAEAWKIYRSILWRQYTDLIEDIKSDKETYLQCIDAEFAKGESSEYSGKVAPYDFRSPTSSLMGNPPYLAKLDYLEVFKEFVLNDTLLRGLPQGLEAVVYLKCGCRIPFYHSIR